MRARLSPRSLVLAAAACAVTIAAAACGSHARHDLPPTQAADLAATLDDLAAFGPKRAGTTANDQAAEYVRTRMEAAGLANVHLEPFSFPRFVVGSASLAVSIDGSSSAIAFDVFEASGSGAITAPVVWVGDASATTLSGVDLTGKIAMVQRVNVPHRAAQLRNVLAKGALAMLYESTAPANLRQIGSVRWTWESATAAPALTLGHDDAEAIHAAITAGKTVTATLDVSASSVAASGHDVVGEIAGSDPSAGTIVIGAHYDTWFAGSVDNGGGVAAMLALAERFSERGTPRATLVFIAYDGEELGLYGGYAWLRQHVVVAGEPVRAVFNFEVPSSADATAKALAHSPDPGVDDALKAAHLQGLYDLYADMQLVPQLFGGIIPTDIQGFYRGHVPTATTAVDSAYYHTIEDTPDKVDAPFLARAVDAFDYAIRLAQAHSAADFQTKDPALWTAAVNVHARSAGDPVVADVVLTDSTGIPQVGANTTASLLVDDFTLAGEETGLSDSAGRVTFTFPAPQAGAGTTSRWLHVTSGPSWPLVESITALQ